MNPADICRECELASRNRELERRLSEMAIEVAIMRLLMLLKTGGKRRSDRNELLYLRYAAVHLMRRDIHRRGRGRSGKKDMCGMCTCFRGRTEWLK